MWLSSTEWNLVSSDGDIMYPDNDSVKQNTIYYIR